MGLELHFYARQSGSLNKDGDLRGRMKVSFADAPDVIRKMRGYDAIRVSKRFEIGHLTKANAIHHWMVKNVMDYNDDCYEVELSKDSCWELRRVCAEVLRDHSLADEELYTVPGFDFGSLDYDDNYFRSLKYCKDLMDELLDSWDELVANGVTISYQGTW